MKLDEGQLQVANHFASPFHRFIILTYPITIISKFNIETKKSFTEHSVPSFRRCFAGGKSLGKAMR
jgi:hypothetical protein